MLPYSVLFFSSITHGFLFTICLPNTQGVIRMNELSTSQLQLQRERIKYKWYKHKVLLTYNTYNCALETETHRYTEQIFKECFICLNSRDEKQKDIRKNLSFTRAGPGWNQEPRTPFVSYVCSRYWGITWCLPACTLAGNWISSRGGAQTWHCVVDFPSSRLTCCVTMSTCELNYQIRICQIKLHCLRTSLKCVDPILNILREKRSEKKKPASPLNRRTYYHQDGNLFH